MTPSKTSNDNQIIDLTNSDGENNEGLKKMAYNPSRLDIKWTIKRPDAPSSAPRTQIRPPVLPNTNTFTEIVERLSQTAMKGTQQTELNQNKLAPMNQTTRPPAAPLPRDIQARFVSADLVKRQDNHTLSGPAAAVFKPVHEKLKKRPPVNQIPSRLGIASTKKQAPNKPTPVYGSPYAPISSGKPSSSVLQITATDGRDMNLVSETRTPVEPRQINMHLNHTPSVGHSTEISKDPPSTMTTIEKPASQHGQRTSGAVELRCNSIDSTVAFSTMLRNLVTESSKPATRELQISRQSKSSTGREKSPLVPAAEFNAVSEVQSIYYRHRETFVTNHQYFVKSWLPRARVDLKKKPSCKGCGKHSILSLDDPRSSFEDMRDVSLSQKPKTPTAGALISTTHSSFHNGLRTPSVTQGKFTPVTRYSVSPVKIPLYTSHTTLKQNVLAENIKKLAVWPHFSQVDEDNAEQDLYPELKERYSHGNPDNRKGTILLREQSKQMSSHVETFLDELGCTFEDVLRYFLDAAGANVPRPARVEILNSNWNGNDTDPKKTQLKVTWAAAAGELLSVKTSKQRQQNVRLACEAFSTCEGFSLWHVVKQFYVERKVGRANENNHTPRASVYKRLECLVCHVHDCDLHGEIREKGTLSDFEDDDVVLDNSSDEDELTNINNKFRVVTRLSPRKQDLSKLAYRLSDGGYDAHAYAGRNKDGSISGLWNEITGEQPSFADDVLCSEACFWLKTNRTKLRALSPWSYENTRVFEGIFAACSRNKRGSCMIATIMGKPCCEIFIRVLAAGSRREANQPPERHKKIPVKKKGVENSIIHNREPFIPCNHVGTCKQARCRCFTRGTHCEKTCTCPPSCDRRFKGCNCARIGMICWQNKKCLCFLMNRECDEDLCKTCGADEVLDPANRYNQEIATGRCTNVGIQRNVPKRTILGSSEVNGFGLFVGEPIKKHEFIAEYRGEIISYEESNRRGAVYDWRPANYLFKLNKNQDIDATHAGNKTRFINNSSNDLNKNCEPALLLCNTVTRIGIYALRDIEPGEELFFNYGYPASKMEKFLEKSQQNGATVLVKAKAPKLGGQAQRMRRKANAESGTLSGDRQLAKSLSRKDGTTENGPDDIVMSDDNEEAEYAAEAELRKLVGGDASSDDDYEDEAAQSSSSSLSEGENASAGRARRNLRSRKRRSISAGTEERAMKMARRGS